jgi:hypothetical protein
LVFVQIDGLSEPVLRQALDARVMPTLARWLRGGTHRLASWEAGLPSETSASQAGILHGTNWDIPGFRWYEKERRHLVSSGVPADAEVYNRRISDGRGLLHADGISIGNNVDGDAVHAVVTMSRLRHPDPADTDAVGLVKPEMAMFLTDWAGVLHAVLHTGWELLVELSEASQGPSRAPARERTAAPTALLFRVGDDVELRGTAPPAPATAVAVRPGRLVEAVAIHVVALKVNGVHKHRASPCIVLLLASCFSLWHLSPTTHRGEHSCPSTRSC